MVDSLRMLPDIPHDVQANHGEGGGGCHLRAQSSDHDIYPNVSHLAGDSCRGYSASNSLQKQGNKVARNERYGDSAAFEEAESLSTDGEDTRQGEVRSGAEESWTDGQTAQIHNEPCVDEVVVVYADTPAVTDNLEYGASQHSGSIDLR